MLYILVSVYILWYFSRPIHDAIESGNLSIVRLLVEHGADPMAEYLEKTPLELAKSLGQIEISKFLSSKRDRINTYF